MSRKGEKRRIYTKEEKYEVAVYYMLYGSQAKAAKMTGIDPRQVSRWVNEDKEFKELYEEAIQNGKIKFDAKSSAIIDNALKLTERKIKQELDLVALGEQGKMNAKDAALTAKVLFDMRQLSRSLPTSIQEKKTTDHLDELAKKFEEIAGISKSQDNDDKPKKELH
jgi:transposase-like protein